MSATAGGILALWSSHPELPLSVGLEGANRPDLPLRAASRVNSFRASGDLLEGLLVDIADWFEVGEAHGL